MPAQRGGLFFGIFMPSKSPAQHRLMEAVAHNPSFAKKVKIPQSVGREFANADKGQSGKMEKLKSNRGKS